MDEVEASTTAGRRFATAVPEDVIMGVGKWVAREWPSAQKARERSSMAT